MSARKYGTREQKEQKAIVARKIEVDAKKETKLKPKKKKRKNIFEYLIED